MNERAQRRFSTIDWIGLDSAFNLAIIKVNKRAQRRFSMIDWIGFWIPVST